MGISPTDEELVARCKKELPGHTHSYEMLVQRHMDHVYRLVYRVVANREEAEDIAQEIFLKVYHGLRTFEQQAAFSSWLYRIATNAALDALAKSRRRPQTATMTRSQVAWDSEEEVTELDLHASPEAGPEERTIQSELWECINRALNQLEREQAQLIVWRDFDDMRYDEIARMMNLGLGAIKMRIHRARLAFQETFDHLCGGSSPNYAETSRDRARMKKR